MPEPNCAIWDVLFGADRDWHSGQNDLHFTEKANRQQSRSDEKETAMEDPRCRSAAVEVDEPRCKNMLVAATIGIEDPRSNGLLNRAAFVSEVFVSRGTTMKMEDPRCQSLHINW